MSLHHMYIKSGDGFLLVFSLTSLESVSELYHLREQIQRIKDASNTTGLVSFPLSIIPFYLHYYSRTYAHELRRRVSSLRKYL